MYAVSCFLQETKEPCFLWSQLPKQHDSMEVHPLIKEIPILPPDPKDYSVSSIAIHINHSQYLHILLPLSLP